MTLRRALPVAAILLLCLWQGAFAAQSVVSDLRYAALEAELSFWGSERYTPTEATRARTDRGITRLTDAHPTNADYHILRATEQAWQAFWATEEPARRHHEQAAISAYQQALQARPAHAQTAQTMLEYAQRLPNQAAAVQLAENHLAKLVIAPQTVIPAKAGIQ